MDDETVLLNSFSPKDTSKVKFSVNMLDKLTIRFLPPKSL